MQSGQITPQSGGMRNEKGEKKKKTAPEKKKKKKSHAYVVMQREGRGLLTV